MRRHVLAYRVLHRLARPEAHDAAAGTKRLEVQRELGKVGGAGGAAFFRPQTKQRGRVGVWPGWKDSRVSATGRRADQRVRVC